MMFGGSPMRVAVPPMLEARIPETRYGIGEISRRRATDRMTGVIRTTVVTLSRNADRTAVTVARIRSSRIGWPRERMTDRIASHSKKPVLARTEAITIIPASRKMTLRSTAANASCWSITPRTMTSIPPINAISVRSQRSSAIRT